MIVTGIGYDSHRLVEGRSFVLAGVKIPYDRGFLAHSDGDVFVHALIDALLGASGKDDIGTLFPDTDDRYKNLSSLSLLEYVVTILKGDGQLIEYIDSVIIAQEPKLAIYKDKMKENIARVLGITKDRINIKAKTNEGLDAVGKKEAVACFVVASLDRKFR